MHRKKVSSYSGLQKGVRKRRTPPIETWENEYRDKDYWVTLRIPEFTCVCPKTNLPDFAVIAIEYIPDKECVELKSLKEYINSFRDVGIFHEHAVNRILDDFVSACKPREARVRGEFNVRGGIQTTVVATYRKKS